MYLGRNKMEAVNELNIELLNAKDIRSISTSLNNIDKQLTEVRITQANMGRDISDLKIRLANLEKTIASAVTLGKFIKQHWKSIFIFFTILGGFLAYEIIEHFPFWVSVLKTLK